MSLRTENKIILYPEYRCRICLEATNGKIALNYTITNIYKAEVSLKELLEFCVNEQVCNNGKADGLCVACLEKGIVCYDFKKKFEESQSILLKEIEEDDSFSFVIKTEEDLEEEDLVVITDNEVLRAEISDDDVSSVATGNEAIKEEISDVEVFTEDDEILKEEILEEKTQITETSECQEDKHDILITSGDKPTAITLEGKKHQCDICEVIYQSSSGLSRHKHRHNHFRLYKCEICGKTCANRATLTRHNLKHQENSETRVLPEQENTDEFKCGLCEKAFKVQGSLVRHARIVHKTRADARKQIPCPTCGRIFFRKGNLREHILTHSFDKKFLCEICPGRFTTSKNLARHRRTHTGQKPHNCSECGKGFADVATLRWHLVAHSKKREHICQICGSTFARPGSLSVHMKTHSAERPFKCTICPYSFKFSSLLKKHMVTHTGAQNFACEFCEKRFTQSSSLGVHRKTHTGETPHVCKVCGKGFIRGDSLRIHMNTHSSDTN